MAKLCSVRGRSCAKASCSYGENKWEINARTITPSQVDLTSRLWLYFVWQRSSDKTWRTGSVLLFTWWCVCDSAVTSRMPECSHWRSSLRLCEHENKFIGGGVNGLLSQKCSQKWPQRFPGNICRNVHLLTSDELFWKINRFFSAQNWSIGPLKICQRLVVVLGFACLKVIRRLPEAKRTFCSGNSWRLFVLGFDPTHPAGVGSTSKIGCWSKPPRNHLQGSGCLMGVEPTIFGICPGNVKIHPRSLW